MGTRARQIVNFGFLALVSLLIALAISSRISTYLLAPLLLTWSMFASNFVRLTFSRNAIHGTASWRIEKTVIDILAVLGYGAVIGILVALFTAGKGLVGPEDVYSVIFDIFLDISLVLTAAASWFMMGWLVVFIIKQATEKYAHKKGLLYQERIKLNGTVMFGSLIVLFVCLGLLSMLAGLALIYLAAEAVATVLAFLFFIANANDEDLSLERCTVITVIIFLLLMGLGMILEFFAASTTLQTIVILVEVVFTMIVLYVAARYFFDESKPAQA